MAKTVSDFFWERLHQWGVRTVFGYSGDGNNGLLGALDRFGTDKMKFVQVRHEEMAAFMATAYAKFTGELGVCMATSGPGASHMITGLYDARLDHMPVLAITGQQATTAIGTQYQQELDVEDMYKDVASDFVRQAMVPGQVRHLIDRAIRIALGKRRVTALVFPNDLQEQSYADPPRKHGTAHTGVGYRKPKVVPFEEDLRAAAEVLNAGKKVAILVGAGALGATDEVIAAADKL
jgi:pyruvate dehydrogenase (quinone)